MSDVIRIVCVGPAESVQGGISRVIGIIRDHLPDRIRFHHVSTYTRYTGAAGTHPDDRGSRLNQTFVFMSAFAQLIFFALSPRTVFHIHLAVKGSLLRKGVICILLRVLQRKYVVHCHGSDGNLFHQWLPAIFRRSLIWGIRGAGKLIALTPFWYDHYSELFCFPPSRVLLLPNPTIGPKAIPDRSHRQGTKLLFLGRIGEHKGALDVIHAFAALPKEVRKSCSLTLAGDGDLEAAKRLVMQLECSSQVSVSGWVGAREVDRLLAESDVFLLPSHNEGMAMSLIEAMSWGLAVITTDVGGAGAFLELYRNSLVVSPGDIQGLRNAIHKLILSPSLRLSLGLAAHETANRFNIDNYIAKLINSYEEIVSELPSAGAESHHYER